MKQDFQQPGSSRTVGWKRCLLHVHTFPRSYDASLRPEDAIQKAEALGVRVLVFTEHERSWKSEELEVLKQETGTDLLLIGARELGLGDGHLIIIGCETPLFGGVKTIIEKVHDQGGAVIMAHPFDLRYQIPPRTMAEWGVDAVETVNLQSRNASKEDLERLSLLNMTCVAGADAHRYQDRFEGSLTLVPDWVKSERDLVRCLLKKEIRIEDDLVAEA